MMGDTRRWLPDAAERVLWTAIQAAGGAALDVVSSGHVTWRAVAYAAALAAAKVICARQVGRDDTASTLPTSADPATLPPTNPSPREAS